MPEQADMCVSGLNQQEAGRALERIRPYVNRLSEELLDISHKIHDHPEVRFQEEFASRLLSNTLETYGFAVTQPVAGLSTAFSARTAHANQASKAPTIAIFCEYDALEGIGHGCGHNVIAASGLGAAIAAKQWLDDHPEVPGNLLVLGSPGEEGGGGKAYLIDAGYLEAVDAALMVHPTGYNEVHMPTLARTALDITFTGRPAHAAAAPHEGINALDAANLTFVAIGMLRQQVRSDARVHGIITDGGQAPNIVPERTSLRFYVRSPDADYLKAHLLPAVENCAAGAALATGTAVEVTKPAPSYANLRTNAVLAQAAAHNLAALGRDGEPAQETNAAGSTDMGNVSQLVPSIHPCIALTPGLTMHTREAADAACSAEGDRAVIDGACLLATTVTQLFSQPDILAAAQKEFQP